MRIIPKKSKITSTIWKTFSFLDIIIAFILFVIAAIIFMSNLSGKFYVLIIYIIFSIVIFFQNEGLRAYQEIGQVFKYISLPHKFSSEQKAKGKNINRLIPYTRFEEDGTICYGTYYGKVLSINSIEYRLLNEFMQNTKVGALAQLMNSLSIDQSMQIIKIDRPINFDTFAHRLFNRIRTEEEQIKKDILKSRLNQIDEINNVEKQYRPYFYFVFYDPSKENLLATINTAKGILTNVNLDSTELTLKETALFLKYCYTRNFDERDIDNFEQKDYLEYIKPQNITFTSTGYTIDNVSAFIYAISDYPTTVTNAWGAALFNIDNTKVVLNVRPIEKEKAIKRIDKVVTELGTRDNVNKASEVVSQETHLETMGALLQSLQNENEAMFDCTLTVTGFNNNAGEKSLFRKQVRQKITSSGFRIHSLRCRQIDGFISSNVTRRSNLKVFERGINSESLAAVFPFVFTSILEEDGITLGYNDYPIILDPWKRSEKYVNSNMMIIGKSGGGKSYFTKLLLSNLYSENSKIFILDPENEYSTLAKNVNGTFVDVGNATTGRLNPFHIYQILTDDGKPAPEDITFFAHLRFLESFFQVTLPGIHSDTMELLNNLIVKVYERKNINSNTDCLTFGPDKFPIFDDLMAIIRDQLGKEKNPMAKENLQRAESYISKFSAGGRNSNLWNGPSSLTSDESFTVFNFQSLLAGKNNVIANGQMLLVMKFLEQQIINIREQNKSGSEIHPVVVLDEGYTFVDPKHPVALDFAYSCCKRIRKYSGTMIFITQNLNDLQGNQEILNKTTAIINNSQYSFIFPLAPADVLDLVDLYRGAGEINETEQNEISNNGRGRVFVVSAPNERTCFNVVASDFVENLFTNEISKKAS